MRKLNLGLLLAALAFFNACSSNTKTSDADRSTASERSENRPAQPAKTFNQYHNDWNY